MNVVGKVGSLIAQGVYTVSTPIHPFGGAVDIIVVQQPDGSFRSTPWYVRFGKFQGVLKGAEKIVRIEVDGVEADFHMLLDNSGEAYFLREISSGKDSECNDRTKDSDSLSTARDDASSIDYNDDDDRRKENIGHYRHEDSFSGTVEVLQDEHISLGVDRIEINESDNEMPFYDFQDEHSFLDDSLELSEYGSSRYDNLDSVDDLAESRILDSEVVLVSVDGTILTAPISSLERNLENLKSRSPQFQPSPGEGTEVSENIVDFSTGVTTSAAGDVQEVQNNSNAVERESNFHEGHQGDDCQDQETQMDEGKQEIKQSTAANADDASIGLKRDDVFKSCLELHELDRTKSSLSVGIQGDDEDPQEKFPQNLSRLDEDEGESVGISVKSEADEDPGENSPQNIVVADEVDDGEVSVLFDSDKTSLLKSNSPSNTTYPDSEVEKELVETNVTPTSQNFPDTSPVSSPTNDFVNSPTNDLEQKNYVGSNQQQSNSERAVSEGDCTQSPTVESRTSHEEIKTDLSQRFEISLCGNLLSAGMGSREAAEIFYAHQISEEEYKISPASIIKNENLVVRFQKKYLTWEKAAPVVLGMAAYGLDLPVEHSDFIRVEQDEIPKHGEDECALPSTPSGRRWRLWSLPFRRVKTLEHTSSNLTAEEVVANVEHAVSTPTSSVLIESPHKQLLRTNVPTSEEIASLNLKEGKNMVNFIFSAGVLGKPNEVQAHIYLWKWNARIVISDVDGTITKSDVLGQFMPLVGRDWTQSGVARLFGAIKENGYQLLFLSARAIVQAYLTRSFLVNLKQVYILLYKEVALALKINSMYSKRKLLSIHENIKVLRYPDHFSSGVYLWSHHEKLVIIDNHICFIGGLDLCFGRYDSSDHKVGDFPPNIWPGKDYYNPRESEPYTWEDTMTDEIDREQYPRMPWHDVHCALWGPPCRDVARHFVQRWNYAKRSKAPNEQTIPLLMPQQHMVIPRYMKNSKETLVERRIEEDTYVDIKRQDSDSSLSSSQDIPLLIPQEADGPGASNEDSKSDEVKMDHDFDEQPSRDSKVPFCYRKLIDDPSVAATLMKGFVNDLDSLASKQDLSLDVLHPSNRTSEKEWSETQEQDNQVVPADETTQVGPRVSCCCQVIRSISQWSAGTSQVEESIHRTYCSLIEKAEHFVYIENQFFISGLKGDETIQNRVLESMYRRILRAHDEKKSFRVIIVIPLLPGFQGGIDDAGAASVRAIMHWQYRTICRGENSILHNLHDLLGARMHDYISFYGLRSYGRLFDSGPVASSQVYVHSKVMIIDDCTVLIGSANINDRSLLGSRDSEIGVLIEDKELVDSYMGGKPWKAGKFASSLRHSLWSEHLGLKEEELAQIIDPVIDSTYKDIWMATAKTNTMIYQDVISCIPNDLIQSRAALRESMTYWKQKLGHTTIDLGIAPMTLESYQDGNITEIDPMERLKSVKGHLVSFPLKFMCEEDLRPGYNESEYYASPQVFH